MSLGTGRGRPRDGRGCRRRTSEPIRARSDLDGVRGHDGPMMDGDGGGGPVSPSGPGPTPTESEGTRERILVLHIRTLAPHALVLEIVLVVRAKGRTLLCGAGVERVV